uniref:Uncharacterized protein n=1 Tax=Mustela putorius furo TaxID=9669 RepID=M3YN34_MUSPF
PKCLVSALTEPIPLPYFPFEDQRKQSLRRHLSRLNAFALPAKADLVTQLWSKRCLLKLLGKFFPPRPWKAPPFCFDHDM